MATTRMKQLFSNLTAKDITGAALGACIIGFTFYIYHFIGVSDVGYFYQDATRSIFTWAFTRWRSDFNGSPFAVALWALPASLLMIAFRWRVFTRHERSVCWPGVVLVLAGLVLHWAGLKTEQTRISAASLVLIMWAIPMSAFGWSVARHLLVPAMVLTFFMPLNFLDVIAYKAQAFTAATASLIMSGLGFEVTRAGSSVISGDVPGLAVRFADRFSHLQVYLAHFITAVMCGYFLKTSLRVSVLFVAASPLLLLAGNTLRGVLVMAACMLAGSEDAVSMSGVFSLAFTILLPFGGLILIARKLQIKYAGDSSVITGPPARTGTPAAVPLAINLLLLVGAALVLPRIIHVTFIDKAGVNLAIPAELDGWRGQLMVFCHNPEHQTEPVIFDHQPGDACPRCGSPLEQMMPYEKLLMPPDTIVRKHQYVAPDETGVIFTTVLSGQHRGSIHRPEVCLVGGEKGTQIETSFIHPVTLDDGKVLEMKVLEMNRLFKRPDGSTGMYLSYYAYWFAGIDRETASHIERMIWMAGDRLLEGKSYRWAYNAVSSTRQAGNREYLAQLDAFVRAIYPHLRADVF